MKKKCSFCEKLKNNEYEVYKDDLVTVLFDYDPISKGHILILPNDHYLDIDEIPDEVLTKIFQLAKVHVRLLKEKFQPKGYSMMQNGGAFNDIEHFHLHVFPRFSKDEFGWTYANKVDAAATQYDHLKELFRADILLGMKNIK